MVKILRGNISHKKVERFINELEEFLEEHYETSIKIYFSCRKANKEACNILMDYLLDLKKDIVLIVSGNVNFYGLDVIQTLNKSHRVILLEGVRSIQQDRLLNEIDIIDLLNNSL